jgi:hypothetical protein
MVQEIMKKEVEKLEKAGKERRTAGRGGPPVAPPRELQLSSTKANLPGPLCGFQMTISAVH